MTYDLPPILPFMLANVRIWIILSSLIHIYAI